MSLRSAHSVMECILLHPTVVHSHHSHSPFIPFQGGLHCIARKHSTWLRHLMRGDCLNNTRTHTHTHSHTRSKQDAMDDIRRAFEN